MDFSKHSDKFTIDISGNSFGSVTYYKVYKDMNPDTATMRFTVTIKRRMPPTEGREVIDFFDIGNVTVNIRRRGITTKYASCHIDKVSEELEDDKQIYQTIVCSTTEDNRTIVK